MIGARPGPPLISERPRELAQLEVRLTEAQRWYRGWFEFDQLLAGGGQPPARWKFSRRRGVDAPAGTPQPVDQSANLLHVHDDHSAMATPLAEHRARREEGATLAIGSELVSEWEWR